MLSVETKKKPESACRSAKDYKNMTTSPGDLSVLHALLSFPISAGLPFLLLKYQKADVSPFDDNNIIILAILIAIITYVVAMVTEVKLRILKVECPKVISHISLLSAALASVLLAMILFPYLGWFLLVMWIGFFVKLALDSYQEVFHLLLNAAGGAYQIGNKLLGREPKINNNQSSEDSQSSAPITSEINQY